MTRFILSISASLLLFVQAFAVVNVNPADRVPNIPNGFCAWTSLETAGRNLGIRQLHGLAQRKFRELGPDGGGALNKNLIAELERLEIPYQAQVEGTKDVKKLFELLDSDRACIVGLFDYPFSGDYHAVLLTGREKEEMWFIDPNDVKCVYRTNWAWFWTHWDGGLLALVPN